MCKFWDVVVFYFCPILTDRGRDREKVRIRGDPACFACCLCGFVSVMVSSCTGEGGETHTKEGERREVEDSSRH